MTAFGIAQAQLATPSDGVDHTAPTGQDAAIAERLSHPVPTPSFPEPKPVKAPCPICRAPASWQETEQARVQAEQNYIDVARLITGEFPMTDESRALRGEAMSLLGDAMLLEREHQLAVDLTYAQSWAQAELTQIEAQIAAERQALADHEHRENRLAKVTGELADLGSRYEAAQVSKAEAETLDARIASETTLTSLERLIASLEAERRDLLVPFNESAIRARIAEREMDRVVWADRVAHPDQALRVLCDQLRERFGHRLTLAIRDGNVPLSHIAFEFSDGR